MKFFLKISITLGLATFFIFQIAQLQPNYDQARIKALNTLAPDAFDDLILAGQGQAIKPQQWIAYLRYFKDLVQLSPERADALGMQGFCYAQLGQYDRAIELYSKAKGLVPQFLGFRYNLAVLYFKTRQYPKAVEESGQVLAYDPKESLIYIFFGSKIYGMIMLSKSNKLGQPVEQQLKNIYEQARLVMLASQYCLMKDGAFPGEEKIFLESF